MKHRSRKDAHNTPSEAAVDEESRTVYFFGVMDDATVAQSIMGLAALDTTDGPVRLVIASCGGDVDAGTALYEAIRIHHNPVIIDVLGHAYSMATMVLQAGSVRRASPETRIMVHQGVAGIEPIPTLHVPAVSREIARSHNRYCEILAERSGQPITTIRRLCRKESFMSATEAVRMGLLDEVLKTYNPMKFKMRRVRRRKR